MAQNRLYGRIKQAREQGEKLFVVLIDPDKTEGADLERLLDLASGGMVDILLVGGSLMVQDGLDACLAHVKAHSPTPVVLFPGSTFQINRRADGILFLSLLSGRNADLLIGQQVIAAPYLRSSGIEVLSTGYVLVDGGVPTTVSYMSNTQPIPFDKPDIAMSTALAGQMLGMGMIYLDAGSGARRPVSDAMIRKVRAAIDIPLIVGGGIRSPERARAGVEAGADIIVVGNILEKEPTLLAEMAEAVHSYRPVDTRFADG